MTYYVLSNVSIGHTFFSSVSSENVVGGDNNTIYGNVLFLNSSTKYHLVFLYSKSDYYN